MKDLELGWLAGIVDGEGCITIRCRRNKTKTLGHRMGFYCQLVVANTSETIINRCQSITGLGRVYVRKARYPNSQDQYIWETSSEGLRTLIPLLKPICDKRDELEVVERVLDILKIRHSIPNGGSGAYRTNEEIKEIFDLRLKLMSLHGRQSLKLSKFTNWDEFRASLPLRVEGLQVVPQCCEVNSIGGSSMFNTSVKIPYVEAG
jgi:hypothetical protein